MKHKEIYIGLCIVIIVLFIAIFGTQIAPNDPLEMNPVVRLKEPCGEFPLGTDQLGRCILSRIICGAKYSITIAILIIVITAIIGVTLGILSGFFGGKVDWVIMRGCEIILSFPDLLLSLVIVGYLGAGIFNLTIALVATSWAGYTRICRALVLSVKESDYIKAGVVCGTSRGKLILRHVLPNIMPTVITMIISSVGSTLLMLSGLSFIGLGVQPPVPEWGMMINEGRTFLEIAPGNVIYPIIAIFITVLGFNLLGDGIRKKLNPKSEV